MNFRIYEKISTHVKLEKRGKKYIVSQRKKGEEWNLVYSTVSLRKALNRKHNAMRIVVRDLGHLPLLLERIRNRKVGKYHKKKKRWKISR